jgi:membrane protein YqaA with SNARE-associated domain
MKAMVWMVATTIGGAVGWWIGAFVWIFTAVSLSAQGSADALFYAQRLANDYLP